MQRSKICRVLSGVVAVGLLFSAMSVKASEKNAIIDDIVIKENNIERDEVSITDWKDWAYDALWYIAKRISSGFFTKTPVRNITEQRIELTTGAIEYNTGDVGTSSYIDVQAKTDASSINMDVTLKASTDFLNALSDTISVTLTKPNGTYGINQVLGHNGMAVYSIKNSNDLGKHRATFTENDDTKWDCGVIVYDYNVSSVSQMSEVYNDNYITDNNHARYYLIPSESQSSESVVQVYNYGDINSYTVEEVYNQFYDQGLGEFVYILRDHNIGDEVVVSDVISNIAYDEDLNRTIFEFETKYGAAKWPFDGNLCTQYHKGEIVKFRFDVVSEFKTEDIEFENINYFVDAYRKLNDSDVDLEINNYLLD